ncbi:hypothetical protein L596_027867 [Steinernema carpocapsae]|uniref:Uncharacterized protein n=1 Tax=Steinernema carpocapsae TaxID=34508 RepID=A0A4U5LWT6_STECR|nr:hypothetical protein L596_027867 [Steinernema carpocapsae]
MIEVLYFLAKDVFERLLGSDGDFLPMLHRYKKHNIKDFYSLASPLWRGTLKNFYEDDKLEKCRFPHIQNVDVYPTNLLRTASF